LRLPLSSAQEVDGEMILVVEDEPEMAELNRRHLTRAGYHVLIATNAREGLEMARTYAPDLILLDVLLPGTDGLTLLDWLKSDETTASIPVLLLSILPDDGQGRTLGAVDYLNKPVTSDLLLSHVREILAAKRSPLILLADSNVSERERIRHDLHRNGFRTLSASTETEVLQAVSEDQPDLLLLDMQSTQLDALEILRAVRSNEQEYHLPVIMMMGAPEGGSEVDLSALRALNHAEFLSKPFSAEELAALIANQRPRHK
jgi:DNA-binding response OmpR family regulator